MEADEYIRLAQQESMLWWFGLLHRNLFASLDSLGLPGPGLKCADFGCGTGSFIAKLRQRFPTWSVVGIDKSRAALEFARQNHGPHFIFGDVQHPPFKADFFDIIFAVDVMYHRDVQPARVLNSIFEVLKPGGMVILNNPAYEWLHSYHDVYVHTARRYTTGRIAADLNQAGFTIVRCTYWNTLLFPLMVLKRKLLTGSESRSDVAEIPSLAKSDAFVNFIAGIYAVAIWHQPSIRRLRACNWTQRAMTRKLLSILVPVYNGADTIVELVEALTQQSFGMALEIVLVNDASKDDSQDVCERLLRTITVPVTLITHSRNFGEHNAVMTGLRHAKGDYIVTMDDDLQNPPSEILKLLDKLRTENLDIVYGQFLIKRHANWRNIGSKSANLIAEWLTDKPRGLYMSTFRCMTRFLVTEILNYRGPYPFIDGLVFQITDRIGSAEVMHLPNKSGRTNYTLRKLVNLWLTILINFSTRPLQLSISLGFIMATIGVLGAIYVVVDYFVEESVSAGWTSIVVLMLVFTGTQLIILGLMGEYIGRMFIHVGGRPQAIVRSMTSTLPTCDVAEVKSSDRLTSKDI